MLKTSSEYRPRTGFFYGLRRWAALRFFALSGWRVEGEPPPSGKAVVIAAPHTSNWDLPFMLAVAYHFRISLKWMGKDSLFKPPFGWLMKAMGGIPIDRSKANDVVAQMVAIYGASDQLMVAIPPEGTRSKARRWKTGFYNIAHGAGVPVVLGFLDYERKVGGIGKTVWTTGDYARDMVEIKAFYAPIIAKHGERYELHDAEDAS